MSKRLQLVGQRFGRWTVIEFVGVKNHKTMWKVRCDCGNEKILAGTYLSCGNSRSCGCLVTDMLKSRAIHGLAGTKIYYIWADMRYRCKRPDHKAYARYGGRGIKVCERWQSFENFLEDMGKRPEGRTLDRIDNDGNYEPSNCRWSTYVEQTHNTRRNRWITFQGRAQIVGDWAKEVGISESLLRYRLNHGWSTEKALTTKPKVYKKR